MQKHQLPEDLQDFLNISTTANFLKSARQFVNLLELGNIDNKQFYKESHLALSDLYTSGQKFEEVTIKYSNVDSNFDRDTFFENKNAGKISTLGGDAFYWEVFDPTYDKEKEPSQGWLVDDFSDIYRDLKIELNKIDTIGTGEAVEDALWQLKWSFLNHWGQHCICALRALHYLVYAGKHCM